MKPFRVGIDCRKILDYGIGTITSNLIEHLAFADTETEYFLLGDPKVVPKPGPNFTIVGEKCKRYSIIETIKLPLKSRLLHLDLLHWMHYASSPFKHGKYVVSIHDVNHLIMPDLLNSRVARTYAKKMLFLATRVADRVVTATKTSKAEIVEHLCIPESKVSVIYNGVADRFKPQPRGEVSERFRTDCGIDHPYVLYVGSLREHKNVARLIEAFGRLKQRLASDHVLVIAGEHRKQRPMLQEYVRQNGTGSDVRFLGTVPHERLPLLYAGADLFVFPTLYEGFGLPPLEAMACGVPVCLSRIPVLEEVFADAADYFDPLDKLNMTEVMMAVLLDKDKHKDLKEKGLKRASTFSWKRTAEQTLAVYREVLSS